MLDAITQKYYAAKDWLRKERAMRELARAIEGSPTENSGTNNSYKALALFLAPTMVVTASCATSGKGVKPDTSQSETLKPKEWAKNIGYPDSPFGVQRPNGPHTGVDYFRPVGTPVVSAANGEVAVCIYDSGGGQIVGIRHFDFQRTSYAHLSKVLNGVGERVFRGMVIAESGWTGSMRGDNPHLHFELLIGGSNSFKFAVDPYRGHWAGGKPFTYDGVTDYDSETRKTGKLLLSAPFPGPVPHDKVNLEQMIKIADVSDEKIKIFLSNPEQYKKELFDSSMALIAKKNKKLAEDLAGLPILNDSVDAQEALSVWGLYDQIRDDTFSGNSVAVKYLKMMVHVSDEHKKKVGSKVYQWNFWLQEVVRYGQNTSLSELFKTCGDKTTSPYTPYGWELNNFFECLWKKQ